MTQKIIGLKMKYILFPNHIMPDTGLIHFKVTTASPSLLKALCYEKTIVGKLSCLC